MHCLDYCRHEEGVGLRAEERCLHIVDTPAQLLNIFHVIGAVASVSNTITRFTKSVHVEVRRVVWILSPTATREDSGPTVDDDARLGTLRLSTSHSTVARRCADLLVSNFVQR